MHHMRNKHHPSVSIVLLASTSGYFGGTGVAAYVASKHGIVGLLRASQTTAQQYGIRINAVAPFFTPTRITAGFSEQWLEAGLEANTPQRVADVIGQVAMDSSRKGSCVLVSALLSSYVLSGGFAGTKVHSDRLPGIIFVRWNPPGQECSRHGLGRMLRIL